MILRFFIIPSLILAPDKRRKMEHIVLFSLKPSSFLSSDGRKKTVHVFFFSLEPTFFGCPHTASGNKFTMLCVPSTSLEVASG